MSGVNFTNSMSSKKIFSEFYDFFFLFPAICSNFKHLPYEEISVEFWLPPFGALLAAQTAGEGEEGSLQGLAALPLFSRFCTAKKEKGN